MENIVYLLVGMAIIAAVGLGAIRLWAAYSGPTDDTSQRVMRWRVSLQFAAVVALAAIFALHYSAG